MIKIVLPVMHYRAMAIFPVIFFKERKDLQNKILINHERIHFAQQMELLFILFYIIYILNYFINLLRYLKHDKAYRNIIFEKEAYENQNDLNYLSVRRNWNYLYI
jgi:hypothetical protein